MPEAHNTSIYTKSNLYLYFTGIGPDELFTENLHRQVISNETMENSVSLLHETPEKRMTSTIKCSNLICERFGIDFTKNLKS